MEILVDQNKLVGILSLAQTVVEKKSNSTQLMNVYLKAHYGTLHVYATDLEVSLVAELPCEVIKEGVATVNAKTFYEITKELSDSKVQIKCHDNHWLDIRQDRFQSRILGIPPSEYPIFALQIPSAWLTLSSQNLKTLINQTEYAISMDTSRNHINGIYLEQLESFLTMAATDSNRLSLAAMKTEVAPHEMFKTGIIIPRKGISEIRKVLDDASETGIKIASDKTQFFIQKPGITLGIRLIDKRFPLFRRFIPNNRYAAIVDKEALTSAIKRVALFSNSKSKAVILKFQDNSLSISTTHYELGDAKDQLSIEFQGPEMSITYNSRFVLDVLQNIEENEAEFLVEAPERATIIRGRGNPDFINVVMPMRL